MVATQCHVIFHSTYVVLILDIEQDIILLNCYIYTGHTYVKTRSYNYVYDVGTSIVLIIPVYTRQ
jgi:hypothetical protein